MSRRVLLWNLEDVSPLLSVCMGLKHPREAFQMMPSDRYLTDPDTQREKVVVASAKRLSPIFSPDVDCSVPYHVLKSHQDNMSSADRKQQHGQWYLYLFDLENQELSCTFDYAYFYSKAKACCKANVPKSKWIHYVTRRYESPSQDENVLLAMAIFFNTRVDDHLRRAIDETAPTDPTDGGRTEYANFLDALKKAFFGNLTTPDRQSLVPAGDPWIFSMHYHASNIPAALIETCKIILRDTNARIKLLKRMKLEDFAIVHYYAAKILFKDEIHYLSIFQDANPTQGIRVGPVDSGQVLPAKNGDSTNYNAENKSTPAYVYTGYRDKFTTFESIKNSEIPSTANLYTNYDAKKQEWENSRQKPIAIDLAQSTEWSANYGLGDFAFATRYAAQDSAWKDAVFGPLPTSEHANSVDKYASLRKAGKRGLDDKVLYMTKRHADNTQTSWVSIGNRVYDDGYQCVKNAVDVAKMQGSEFTRTLAGERIQSFYESRLPECVFSGTKSDAPLFAQQQLHILTDCEMEEFLCDATAK